MIVPHFHLHPRFIKVYSFSKYWYVNMSSALDVSSFYASSRPCTVEFGTKTFFCS
uniref:Uncharacterized protein n=1 Tax=Anguilla anguilla TaxID=7936 RepID=A0A0E9UHX4_ANGAN